MKKQLIITVGREFGSGGREIANKLAERFDIPVYDKEFFAKELKKEKIIAEDEDLLDERPVSPFPIVPVADYTYWIEQSQVAQKEFDFIKSEAAQGHSFLVVGRCAEHVLKDNPNTISFFILGDMDAKIKRIMDNNDLSMRQAESTIKSQDKMRKSYHNFYCNSKWGDSRAYDMCINSNRGGMDKTVDVMEAYIRSVWK